MSVLVSQQSTQNIEFQENKEVAYNNPGFCGPRTYTFVGGMPTFLTLNNPVTTLMLATNNVNDIGVRSVTFSVTLTNRPNVTPIVRTFTVTIVC
jgi:hypothetical protein